MGRIEVATRFGLRVSGLAAVEEILASNWTEAGFRVPGQAIPPGREVLLRMIDPAGDTVFELEGRAAVHPEGGTVIEVRTLSEASRELLNSVLASSRDVMPGEDWIAKNRQSPAWDVQAAHAWVARSRMPPRY